MYHAPHGIVAATGGPLSHTAILAREFGIPCVTAVVGALTAIPPRMRVRVDGTAGTVTRAGADTDGRAVEDVDLSGSAVLVLTPPSGPAADGQAATFVLLDPASADADGVGHVAAAAAFTDSPVGVLQPTLEPPLTGLPVGYRDIVLPGVGRLAWPESGTSPPSRVVVLGPGGEVLSRRDI
ncbi:PEP-utilizing enzyme [Streptosporangium sandarakinum]|uniref:PEP-utilizing enzyme n=1 Tax=Streptosporangium sandarakinum TaxID=1260955 RepID=UPI00339F8DEA